MRVTAVAALLVVAMGCAARVPAPAVVPAPQVPAARPPAPAPRPAAPALDSLPSPAAVAVLATIPEPLAGAAATRPPVPPAAPPVPPADSARAMPAPEAAFDTLRTVVPGGTATESVVTDAGGAVPVPQPTTPMGDRPGDAATLPVAAPPAAAPPSAPAPVLPPRDPVPAREPKRAVGAPGDTCWRVQVAAPAERAKGERTREAAASLLLVPFVVEREGGLSKVRTRDCLTRAAAEHLRDRATASGFRGVFLVRDARGR